MRQRQFDILSIEPDNLKTVLDTLSAVFSSTIKNPVSYKDTGYNISANFGQYTLFPHQKALIYNMYQKEKALRTGTTIAGVQLFGRYSVLGDNQGTGKTLAALAYIAFCKHYPTPLISPYLHNMSHNNFFSFLQHPNSIRTNLFVIPNMDIDNMKLILENQTNLSYRIIKKQNHMSQELIENLPDLIVIPTSQYNSFCQFSQENNLIFERCFFENLENIHLHGPQSTICAHFTWLITHQWFNFIFPFTNLYNYGITLDRAIEDNYSNESEDFKKYIAFERTHSNDLTEHIRSVFARFITTHPLRHKLILLTSRNFLNVSLNPKPIEVRSIHFNHDDRFHVIYPLNSNTVNSLLQDDDITGALESVGAQQIYCQNTMKSACRPNTFDEACPICYNEEIEMKTLTNCCKQLFCARCIISSCTVNKTDKCPLCRQTMIGTKLLSLTNPTDNLQLSGIHKSMALINYLNIHKDIPTMLYFPNQARFQKIQSALKSANIHYELLCGPRNANKTKIDKFIASSNSLTQTRPTKLLIVHDIEHLTGHYIPTVSCLILYPNITTNREREFLLGRIQCLVRAEPLVVVDFVLDETAATPSIPELPSTEVIDAIGTAPASSGDINTNLGESTLAISHT